jgi:hypothetical protein
MRFNPFEERIGEGISKMLKSCARAMPAASKALKAA